MRHVLIFYFYMKLKKFTAIIIMYVHILNLANQK